MSAEERSVSFLHKPVWRRALIVAAGPIANFLLAIVIFTVLFAFIGKTVTDPVVTAVEPGSAAAEAGFQPGDVVRSIDGEAIRYFSDIPMIVGPRPGQPLAVGIERGGQALTLNATPRLETRTDRFGNRIEMGLLGLRSDADQANLRTISFSPVEAFVEGLNETWTIVVRSLDMVKELFTGRQSVTQLSGPVGIAKASGDVWTLGARAVFHWIAFLSVSIGLLNLFPIPMLDGGHLVFYAIEAARGRPVGENAQEVAFRIGLSALLLLMVVALWNDIARLTDRLGGLLS